MKLSRKIALVLALSFLLMQAVQPDRSQEEITADFAGPEPVKAILKEKCYECHSNETQWPWYSYVTPLSWWIAHHVEEGRDELNFSKWGNYSSKSKSRKTEEIFDEIADGHMPLKSYLITHPNHQVTDNELSLIEAWALGE